jgi:predicted RNase H-like HicB family nuclease
MAMPSNVTVIYHYEDGNWWADSPEVERWSAAAPDLDDLVRLATEGVAFALDSDDVVVSHRPAPDLMDIFAGRSAGTSVHVRVSAALRGLLAAPPRVAVFDEVVPIACGS